MDTNPDEPCNPIIAPPEVLLSMALAAIDNAAARLHAIASGEAEDDDLDAAWEAWREARARLRELVGG